MAKVVKRSSCSTCGKENGHATCEGCSKVFCVNHFNSHRQELGEQLDEIEVSRDVFRQSLTEKISDPKKHSLIEQIDQWEDDSINKIRQAAEENRQVLFRHTFEINKILEDKLSKLTDQLRKGREENAFSELDLDAWKEQLKQLKNELENPSSITLRQSSTALVTKITVSRSDKRDNTKSNATTSGAFENTHAPDQTVFCTFCDDQFTSIDAMAEHLMVCGNKTYQCPNCRKHVRRAIFVYHYENDCANPDDPTPDDRIQQNKQDCDKPRLLVKCEYCKENYKQGDGKRHKEYCLRNPANRSKNKQPIFNEHLNRNSGQSNDSDEDLSIPCEWCNKGIKFNFYDNHTRHCREEYLRQQKQAQPVPRENSSKPKPSNSTMTTIGQKAAPSVATCVHCGSLRALQGLVYHQLVCKMNPNRIRNI